MNIRVSGVLTVVVDYHEEDQHCRHRIERNSFVKGHVISFRKVGRLRSDDGGPMAVTSEA